MNSASSMKNITPTVALADGGKPICTNCKTALGDAGTHWKEGSIRKDVPIAEAGGPAYDTGHEGVALRHFYCPECATLLDTETATFDDPSLLDQVE